MVAGAAGAWRILVGSELRRRRETYALLVGVFLLTTAALALILGSVAGVMGGIGGEIRDTLSADARIVMGDPTNLGGGRLFEGAEGAARRLELASGAAVVPRVEVQGVLLHTDRYEEFDSGLLVGVHPERDARAADVPARVVEGRWLDAQHVWHEGTPYPQLVVGEDMLRALNMSVYEGGPVGNEHLLNVTAGRFAADAGEVRPVVRTGIVVGAFHTGFNPIDRRTVYLHIDTARELLRAQFDDDAANLLVARGGDPAALADAARAEGFEFADAGAFRDHYLSAVVVPLRAFTTLVTLVVLALAGGWVAHVVAGAVLGDRRRIAVLRALGIPARLIVGPIAVLLVAAAAAGAALGLVAAAVLGGALGAFELRVPGIDRSIDVALSAATAVAIVAGVLATAALSAGGAGAALRRIRPLDALRD